MKKVDFVKAVQARVARIACGSSATRGQGSGVAESARNFLTTLPLNYFVVSHKVLFERRLDDATVYLEKAFPKKVGSWGLARKLLNIFLRDALYTSYLDDKYALSKVEGSFEVPLDSITASKIREIGYFESLPRWPGVRHLDPELSELYQLCALDIAEERQIPRVHLDTYFWGLRDY